MFEEKNKKYTRKEIFNLSTYAKENMQIIHEVGHFKNEESHISILNEVMNDTFLVLYVIEGNLIFKEEKEIALSSKDTLLHNCNKECSLFFDQCEVYYALIQGKNISHYLEKDRYILDFRFSKKTEIFFYSVFSSLDKYKQLDECSLSASLFRFYSDLLNFSKGFEVSTKKQDIVGKALKFIENNYHKDIRLSDIASASGYSEYYFLHIFKEVMLITPYEYLIRKRLSQVKILLLTTDRTVEDIAYECGFKSEISLYKAFKNTYSTTPKAFKKI